MQTLTSNEYQHLYEQAKWRRENGLIKQGQWLDKDIQKDGMFCGCMHGSITQLTENVIEESSKATGFPLWLSDLTEKIFEGLSYNDAQVFPEQVFKAFIDNQKVCGISHNDFYNVVRSKVEVDRIDRLISYTKEEQLIAALKEVKRLWINGGTAEEWAAARADALSVVEYASYVSLSAAESARTADESDWPVLYAAKAALSTDESAESAWAAWYAARSAARSSARSAARSAEYYKLERDSLLNAIINYGSEL